MSYKTDNTKTKTVVEQSNEGCVTTEQIQSKASPNGMTPENATAINIMRTEGSGAAVKYMFNPTGERQLSYAEMRSMFG
jgi:hypothetical protein